MRDSKPSKSGRHIERVSGRAGMSDSSNMATGFAHIQTTACKQAHIKGKLKRVHTRKNKIQNCSQMINRTYRNPLVPGQSCKIRTTRCRLLHARCIRKYLPAIYLKADCIILKFSVLKQSQFWKSEETQFASKQGIIQSVS